MKKAVVGFLCGALLATPAVSRDMVGVVISLQPGSRLLGVIDADTIKDIGPYKRAWFYIHGENIGQISYIAYLQEFDCKESATRDISASAYMKNGDFGAKPEINREWDYPVPGTRAANVLDYVCSENRENRVSFGDFSMEQVIVTFNRVKRPVK